VTQRALEEDMVINAQKKPAFILHTCSPQCNSPRKTPTHPLKVQQFSLVEMEDYRRCGVCYSCDEKYALGHRCKEHKLFQIDMNNQAYTKIHTQEDIEPPFPHK
jgi:hypothetical protein